MRMKSLDLLLKEFGRLTVVQEKGIPAVYSGKHVLVMAGTGEGKTETAVLPVFERISGRTVSGVSVLYITPLRALNRDLTKRITKWAKAFGLTVSVRHGDTSQYNRSKQLRSPPDVLVTTPESLAAMLSAPKMSGNLKTVRHVIVDEAHELYPSKRGTMLAVLLERLAEKAGDFQRILLSATISDPEKTAEYFFGGREHEIITGFSGRKPVLMVELIDPEENDRTLARALDTPAEVIARARRIIELSDSSICFVNTRSVAELLASRIKALGGNLRVHHSSLGRTERLDVEAALKKGEVKGVIATSSLELGIDVGRISRVIQYGSPRQAARLLQRVGRSGHSRDKTPEGVIIATSPFDALESGVLCELALEGFLEHDPPPEKPYDVAAVQSAGMLLSKGRQKTSALLALLRRTIPYKSLEPEEYSRILKQLDSEGLVWLGQEEAGQTRLTRKYYYENLSMIPDEKKFFVKEAGTGKTIAVLDEAFVEDGLSDKKVFIVKGQAWEVIEVTDQEVIVEPRTEYQAAIPAWEGENIPVSHETAERVRQVIAGERPVPEVIVHKNRVSRFVRDQRKCFVPRKNVFWTEQAEDFLIVHSFLGTKANNTLARYFGFLASELLGRTVAVSSGAYHIVFQGLEGPGVLEEILSGEHDLEPVLRKAVIQTGLYQHRLLHVAKRFGLIPKDSRVRSLKRISRILSGTVIQEEAVKEVFSQKFDLRKAGEALSRARVKHHTGRLSPLGLRVMLEELRLPELMIPDRPVEQIIQAVKKALDEKIVMLYCTYCRKPFYRRVADLPEKIVCPYCNSTQVALVKRERMSAALKRKRLSTEEKEFVREVMDTVPVIDSYGKKGVYALLMRGIGPSTAKRVLARSRADERMFWKDLLDAQREYYQHRQYWD